MTDDNLFCLKRSFIVNKPYLHCRDKGIEDTYVWVPWNKVDKTTAPVPTPCFTCLKIKKRPCDTKTFPCQTCTKAGDDCFPLNFKKLPKCSYCHSQQKNCNRLLPCNHCIKNSKNKEQRNSTKGTSYCDYPSENNLFTNMWYRNNQPNLTEDDNECKGCLTGTNRAFGRSCVGQPCTNCIKAFLKSKNRDIVTSKRCIFNLANNFATGFRVEGYFVNEKGDPERTDDDPLLAFNAFKQRISSDNYPNPRTGYEVATAFPSGFRIIPTPSKSLLYGLYAIQLSMKAQYPHLRPSINHLRSQFASPRYLELNSDKEGHQTVTNHNNYNLSQLTAALYLYGQEQDENLQLVALGTRTGTLVDTTPTADHDNVMRIWIHNDDAEVDSGSEEDVSDILSHWSGMRQGKKTTGFTTKPTPQNATTDKSDDSTNSDDDDALDSNEQLDGDEHLIQPANKRLKHQESQQVAMLLHYDNANSPLPKDYFSAIRGPEGRHWKTAFESEYNSLESNGTWIITTLPSDRKALTTRWVLKRKLGPDGSVKRYKARIVVRGFQQREGIDFTEIFATVIKPTTWRVLMVLATHFKWFTYQFDVVTAFLNGVLEEEIYMRPPPGYPCPDGKVLKLVKVLYGLKQASRT